MFVIMRIVDSPFDSGLSMTYRCLCWWIGTGCAQLHQDTAKKDTVFDQEFSKDKSLSSSLASESHGAVASCCVETTATLRTMNRSIECRPEMPSAQWHHVFLYRRQMQKRCGSQELVWPALILCHLHWWTVRVHLLHKRTNWLQLQESNIKSFA